VIGFAKNIGFNYRLCFLFRRSRDVVRYPVRHSRGVGAHVSPIHYRRRVPVLDEQFWRKRPDVCGTRPEGVRLQDRVGHFLRRFLPVE